MYDEIELHLGKIIKINNDGTLNIQDFKTGGYYAYANVAVEHTAADTQQAVEGQHILFFTISQAFGQHVVKVIKIYGSKDADQKLVLSSPLDLAPGEKRIVSQTGATIHVGNGALFIGSMGQSIFIDDDTKTFRIDTNIFKILTKQGFEVTQEGTSLVIKKGLYQPGQETVQAPTMTITLTGDTVQIDTKNVIVNATTADVTAENVTMHTTQDTQLQVDGTFKIKCEDIQLGDADLQPAVKGTSLKSYIDSHFHPTPSGPSGAPTQPVPPEALSQVNKVK